MTKMEVLQKISESHNRLAQMLVSNDNAILLGDTLKDLRMLAVQLQQDIEAERTEQEPEAEEKAGR